MPYTVAVSKDFTFSSQLLNDSVNKAEQQRIVSIVRTGDTSGYYFDLFRSRAKGKNEFHDYIYHNLGDGLVLTSGKGSALTLNPAPDRYQTSVGVAKTRKAIPFPGWKYFSNVETSPLTADTIKGTFNVNLKLDRDSKANSPDGKRYVHVAMPGGNQREYTSAEAPPILEAAGGYEKKNARLLSIRQPGEAWDRPFIVVFEPSLNKEPTVQSVENIVEDGQVIGAEVVCHVDGQVIVDQIIARAQAAESYNNPAARLSFTGRFAIVRTVSHGKRKRIDLYIGDGKELTFEQYQVSATDGKAFKTIHLLP